MNQKTAKNSPLTEFLTFNEQLLHTKGESPVTSLKTAKNDMIRSGFNPNLSKIASLDRSRLRDITDPRAPRPTLAGTNLQTIVSSSATASVQARLRAKSYERALAKAQRIYTIEEQTQAWVMPVVLNLVATIYAELSADIAADIRLSSLHRPSQHLRAVIRQFNSEFHQMVVGMEGAYDLTRQLRSQLYSRSESRMMEAMRWLEREVRLQCPDITDSQDKIDITVYALASQTLLTLVMTQWEEWGARMKHDIGHDLTLFSPYTHVLFRALTPFVRGVKIENISGVVNMISILRNVTIYYSQEFVKSQQQ